MTIKQLYIYILPRTSQQVGKSVEADESNGWEGGRGAYCRGVLYTNNRVIITKGALFMAIIYEGQFKTCVDI